MASSKKKRQNRTQRAQSRTPERPRMSVSQAREDLRTSGQQEGSPGILVIALIGTTLFLAFYYHVLVLNQMTQLSEGLTMLEHRPLGYSVAEVTELAETMSETDRGQLNWVHKTSAIYFPIAFGLATMATVLYSTRNRVARWLTIILALIFVVVDIWEGFAIDNALADPTSSTVQLASTLTVTAWVLLIALSIWIVVLLVTRFVRTQRERAEQVQTR